MVFLKPKQRRLPGFRLTMGLTLTYLCIMVLIPLSSLFLISSQMTWEKFGQIMTRPGVIAAFKLSFATAIIAALINAVFGFLVAWVLTRYRFFGRRFFDAMVDLPFALPTAVAGICLATLYSETGLVGKYLAPIGIKVAYTPLGIVTALIFIGIPFVTRTVQPVLEDLESELEEAASSLGANRFQTFTRVIAPTVAPALLTGFAMAFARAVGEYGSVVFISGNLPMKTEIIPLIIMGKLEQFDEPGAAAIAVVMLLLSFVLLFAINALQYWTSRKTGVSNA